MFSGEISWAKWKIEYFEWQFKSFRSKPITNACRTSLSWRPGWRRDPMFLFKPLLVFNFIMLIFIFPGLFYYLLGNLIILLQRIVLSFWLWLFLWKDWINLRVNVRKDPSHEEGMRKRGPPIWLVFTYIVQFFTLIITVWFVFHLKKCSYAGLL